MSFKNLKSDRICVFGMGKIGIPLACGLLKAGYKVIGVDVNPGVVQNLNNGDIFINEPDVIEILRDSLKENKFYATTDGVKATRESNIMIIIVPVILDKKNEPDLSNLISCCESISKGLKKGDLVITETTLPPGTTEKIVTKELGKSGMKPGEDFYVAHAPERVYSGRILKDFNNYPKIIGGINKKSTEKAKKIYEKFHKKGTILMNNAKEAEITKIFGIVYRNVNIALANEMARICEKLGVDFWRIRDAANTMLYTHILKPGIPGGHCVPVYPYFIIENEKNGLIKKALEINKIVMPNHVINLTEKSLKKNNKKIEDSRILILGRSYRKGVKEDRYSGGILLAEKLKELGAKVTMYDPSYSREEMGRIGFEGAKNLEEAIKDKDCIIIATDWGEFKEIEPGPKTVVIDYMNVIMSKK